MDKEIIQNQYFTPEIEDLHIGYEYNLVGYPYSLNVSKIKDLSDRNIEAAIESGNLIVPYLNSEQIVSEGWKEIHYREYIKNSKRGIIHFFNGQKEGEDDSEYLSTFTIHNEDKTLFEGVCRCINEFRKIVKLLNI